MHGKWLGLPIILRSVSYTGNTCIIDGALATVARCVITNCLTDFSAATLVAICSTILSFSSSNISCVCMELMLLLVTEGSVDYKKLLEFTGTHSVIGICHRNFGPENFGPLDRNFQWKNGPPGPIVLVKWSIPGNLVRVMQILERP